MPVYKVKSNSWYGVWGYRKTNIKDEQNSGELNEGINILKNKLF